MDSLFSGRLKVVFIGGILMLLGCGSSGTSGGTGGSAGRTSGTGGSQAGHTGTGGGSGGAAGAAGQAGPVGSGGVGGAAGVGGHGGKGGVAGAGASNGGSAGGSAGAGNGGVGGSGAAGSTGSAGLSGSTVTATLYNPDLQTILGGPATTVVGVSSPTFPNGLIVGNSAFEINITSNQIIYNPLANLTYGGGTFNGFVFVFANAPTILGVTLDASSNFNPTNISFTGNSVSMNLSADTVATDSVATLDLQLAP
ncbi:MAG TPA: hypothetical protein VLC06_21720 [Polyangia bacterium]|nr:hypothetical protein [Polyangia bacterium]